MFAATFRDYATRTLEGEQRFILVRADAERIMTCFLEYGDHQVTVHDLLHERTDGRWRQTVSSYPKLRLAPEWVASKLAELDFSVKRDATANGMVAHRRDQELNRVAADSSRYLGHCGVRCSMRFANSSRSTSSSIDISRESSFGTVGVIAGR